MGTIARIVGGLVECGEFDEMRLGLPLFTEQEFIESIEEPVAYIKTVRNFRNGLYDPNFHSNLKSEFAALFSIERAIHIGAVFVFRNTPFHRIRGGEWKDQINAESEFDFLPYENEPHLFHCAGQEGATSSIKP